MRHLTRSEIEQLNDSGSIPNELREHFTHCAVCQEHSTQAQRIERVLSGLGRAEPAGDLSAQIIAKLPQQARTGQASPWLGVATLIAAMLGLALAYQTAFAMRANGAFELVSYYTAQPEIVTMYPGQAWTALAAAIPWMTLAIGLAMLVVTLVLTYRWTSRTVNALG